MWGHLLPLQAVLAVLAAGGVGLGQPVLGAGAVGQAGVRAAGLLVLQTSLMGAGDRGVVEMMILETFMKGDTFMEGKGIKVGKTAIHCFVCVI